jgi:hypothetical protein
MLVEVNVIQVAPGDVSHLRPTKVAVAQVNAARWFGVGPGRRGHAVIQGVLGAKIGKVFFTQPLGQFPHQFDGAGLPGRSKVGQGAREASLTALQHHATQEPAFARARASANVQDALWFLSAHHAAENLQFRATVLKVAFDSHPASVCFIRASPHDRQ